MKEHPQSPSVISKYTGKEKANPICHLLAVLGPHHILHVSRIRVNDNYNVLRLKKAAIRNKRTSTFTICYIKVHRKRKGQDNWNLN
jgi:hypothetical protein